MTFSNGSANLKTLTVTLLIAAVGLAGCAGGAERAASLPTPLLCTTVQDLTPAYILYDEYIAELNKRGEDCSAYLSAGSTLRVR